MTAFRITIFTFSEHTVWLHTADKDDVRSPSIPKSRHYVTSGGAGPLKVTQLSLLLLQDVTHLYWMPEASAVTYWKEFTSFQL